MMNMMGGGEGGSGCVAGCGLHKYHGFSFMGVEMVEGSRGV